MNLRASLSEKDDMSVAGFLAACSKLLKGTLRVYTTRSDSSGLSLDTPGWNDTHTKLVTFSVSLTIECNVVNSRSSTAIIQVTSYRGDLLVLFLSTGSAFLIWGAEVWGVGWAFHHVLLLPLDQDFTFKVLHTHTANMNKTHIIRQKYNVSVMLLFPKVLFEVLEDAAQNQSTFGNTMCWTAPESCIGL